MFYAFIVSLVLLILGILLLGVRIFFVKGGEFPNIHIGGNASLKNKGVHCATTQDREAQAAKNRPNFDQIDELKHL